MTKYHDQRRCVVHPSHMVAASLASATESDNVTAPGETSEQESNRVVGASGRVPYEEIVRDKRVDSAQRKTVERHESFQRPVIEYQGQPAQVYLDVSEAKSVEKLQQTPDRMRALIGVEQGKASDVSRKRQHRDRLALRRVEGYGSVVDCLL